MSNDLHEFLVGKNGLGRGAKHIPKIREFIDNQPETSSTFNITQIDDIDSYQVTEEVAEFIGLWRIPEYYGISEARGRVFVNPEGVHANTYTDCVVECKCGAKFTSAYDDERTNLRNEHHHSDDCKPWYRLEARAEMAKMREEKMKRLAKMGLSSKQIGPRLGISNNGVGPIASQNNTSMTALRKEYRRLAGNTYAHLVRTLGVHSEDVGEVYGHDRSTLGRWVREYGDYEPESGCNVRTRTSTGEFIWRHKEPAQVPSFIAGDD